MEEMNIDFDIEDDPIKKFLLFKLEEIKLSNEELLQQIDGRKELFNSCIETMASKFSNNNLNIIDTWQRTLDGKWIIGIRAKTVLSNGLINNINVLLNWDAPTPLTYTTKTFCRYKYPEQHKRNLTDKLEKIVKSLEKSDKNKSYPLENEWICTNEVKDNVSIIVTFDIPEFIEKCHYTLSGIISYQYKNNVHQLNIPNFEITAQSLTNNLYKLKNFQVISGEEEAYLSVLAANEQTDLVVRVSENSYTNFQSILEFEHMFKKVNVVSRTKTVLYADNVAGSTEGFLLVFKKENENLFNLTIFSRNQTNMQRILHFLNQNVPDCVILPQKYKHNLVQIQSDEIGFSIQKQATDVANQSKLYLKEFGKSLLAQMRSAEIFYTKRMDMVPEDIIKEQDQIELNVNMEDYLSFRKELADLELRSDTLYPKIEKLISQTVPTAVVNSESEDDSPNV